ncbi:hypothetical protein NW762_014752 [Fusarium torreyae]|uniref:Uncharacterized protein n=1 Tax=Fusarium torreyae TaxID=1237075 RepID=A0A9W8RI56_9HYPO|nr:hypothetical protein NW762_014752 [Fusarium torreyae]
MDGYAELEVISPRLPVALHVNTESRYVALGYLQTFLRYRDETLSPSYGYYNPKTDYLHIPTHFRRFPGWNSAHVPFPNITMGVQTGDTCIGSSAEMPRVDDVSTHLVSLFKSKLALSDMPQWQNPVPTRIILVAIQDCEGDYPHPDCCKFWPAGEPSCLNDFQPPQGKLVPEEFKQAAFQTEVREWTSTLWGLMREDLGDGDDVDYSELLPTVEVGVMPLTCECPSQLAKLTRMSGVGYECNLGRTD